MATRACRLILCCLSFCFGAAADFSVDRLPLSPAVRIFNDRDGLPQNSIEAITRDGQGFLWVGTQNGAARYDGRNWVIVDMPTPQRSNWVGALLAQPDGLYVGTIGDGLHRWSEGRWTSFRFPGGTSFGRVHLLVTATHGGIWVGTQDEGLWRLQGDRLQRVPDLPAQRVRAVLEEGGSLLAGTEKGLYRFEHGSWSHHGPWIQVNDILRDGSRLLIATTAGLFAQEGTAEWKLVHGLPGPETNRLVFGPGPRGRPGVWVASNKGVAFLEGNRVEALGLESGLPSLACPSLYLMASGQEPPQVWVGTFAGLARWTLGKWNRLRGGPEGLLLFAIAQTSEGSIWAGSMGGGLFRYQGGTWSLPKTAAGPPLVSVLSLAPSSSAVKPGRLWIGSRDQGVAVWENGALRWWEQNRLLPNLSVFTLLEGKGPEPRLWIGTRQGLSVWDGRVMRHFGEKEGLPHPHVTTLLETRPRDGESVLWIGTRGGGLARLIQGRIETLRGDGGQAPMVNGLTLAKDLEGRTWLWVGYGGGGAWRLDPDNPAAPWRHLTFSAAPALPSDMVYQMRADAKGRVYFFTSRGVARLDPEPGGAFPASLHTYTTGDGLPSNGCTMGSSLIDRTGRVWTGTVAGGAYLDSALDQDDREQNRLLLLRSQAAGWMALAPGADLSHDRSRLAFEFALLAFHREGDILYRSQLVGLDSEPTTWRPEGRLEYPVLPPGRYTLKAWGKDHAGNISGPLEFPFRIRPAPWAHPAAKVAYTLLLGGLAWGVHRWRSRRLVARNEALKLQVAKATAELQQSKQALEVLNQDLEKLNALKNEFMGIAAHDLRNPLTGLLLESELLQEETDPERIQAGMDRIQAQGRVMEGLVARLLNANAIEEGAFHTEMRVFDLSPVVWEALVQFEDRARKKNIRLTQDIPLEPMVVRADPLLVRQVLDNLVSNAVKFSPRGTQVEVRLEALPMGVRLSVQDQGPGLTPEDRIHLFGRYRRLSAQPSDGEASVGLGLFIVKQMVDAMEGSIEVESEPGRGACFRVTLAGPEPQK